MARLSVFFGVDDAELQAAIKRAKRGLSDLGGELRTGATDLAKWGAAAVAAGVALSAYMVKQSLAAAEAQAELARQLHTTVNAVGTLEIAAEKSGTSLDEVRNGVVKLDVTLGKVISGSAPDAAAALRQIHLSAAELQKLPVDQRIAAINDNIKQFIPAAQQGAVSAEIFGAKMKDTMGKLTGDEIRDAAHQLKFFGLALTDVDSKKLEMADDAFDEMDLAVKGVWRTISVELAPIIVKVWEEIKKAAKEAGGFGKVATDAFEKVMTMAGFVADAVDGIRRVFSLVADGVIAVFNAMARDISYILFHLLDTLDNLPGVDLSNAKQSILEFNREASNVVESAKEHMDETLMKPLPSDTFKKWVEEARKAVNTTAAVMVEHDKAQEKRASDNAVVMDEQYRKQLESRLQTLREHLMTEEQLSFERQAKELKEIQDFEDAKLVTEEQARKLREEAELAHWERISEIRRKEGEAQAALEKKKNDEIQRGTETFFGNLSGLMNTNSRKAFELGKAAAIGEASVKAAKAVISAWEAGMSVGGPYAPLVAAAYAGAAALNGANMINNIRKQQFGGSGGAPQAPTQGSSGIDVGNAAGGASPAAPSQTTIVQFHGGTESDQDLIRRFANALNENSVNGGKIIVA